MLYAHMNMLKWLPLLHTIIMHQFKKILKSDIWHGDTAQWGLGFDTQHQNKQAKSKENDIWAKN